MHSPGDVLVLDSAASYAPQTEGLFRHLPPESLRAFRAISCPRLCPGGTALFAEGESPRAVHMLLRGRVKLSVSSREGKVLILDVAEPGELLGLSAVVSGLPCGMTAETLEPCLVNSVGNADFLQFLAAHADASLLVARQLSRNYIAACDRIRSLGLASSAAEKLAKLLLGWCAAGGKETERGVRLKVTFTHENIGRMIGTSRETVTRLFADFKARGIVCWEGSTLTVLDRAELEEVARS